MVLVADVRVGIVGYGLAGRTFHAPLIRAVDGLAVTAVVTRSPERAAAVADDNPGAIVCADLDELLATGCDLVVLASPNPLHAEQALAVLAAGRAVVVDKPLAVSADEARRLRDEADRRGLLLSPFHNRRWDSDTLTARALLADGALGRLHRWESRFERFRPQVTDAVWKREPAAGGILLDLGTHLADTAAAVLGRPRSVYAEIAARRPGAQVDDDAFLALAHPDGVTAHLWVSAIAADPGPRLRLRGTLGGWTVPELDGQEAALRAGADPAQPGWGAEPAERWGRLTTVDGSRPYEPVPGSWPSYYRGIEQALRTGGPPPVTADEGVTVLEILDAARRSAAGGNVVEVPDG
jgi:predicted dehydrogenase